MSQLLKAHNQEKKRCEEGGSTEERGRGGKKEGRRVGEGEKRKWGEQWCREKRERKRESFVKYAPGTLP